MPSQRRLKVFEFVFALRSAGVRSHESLFVSGLITIGSRKQNGESLEDFDSPDGLFVDLPAVSSKR